MNYSYDYIKCSSFSSWSGYLYPST